MVRREAIFSSAPEKQKGMQVFHFQTRTVMLNSSYPMSISDPGTYALSEKEYSDSVTALPDRGGRGPWN